MNREKLISWLEKQIKDEQADFEYNSIMGGRWNQGAMNAYRNVIEELRSGNFD